ncbi:MAG TPA: hypothetical protein VGG80_01445 [Acidobacteriaceae bacterium]
MPRPSSRNPKTLRLICWNEVDAAARAILLRRAGYRVIADPPITKAKPHLMRR